MLLVAAAALPKSFSKLGSLRKSPLIKQPELQLCLAMASTVVQGQPPKLPAAAKNDHWLVMLVEWLVTASDEAPAQPDELCSILPTHIEHSERWNPARCLHGMLYTVFVAARAQKCGHSHKCSLASQC